MTLKEGVDAFLRFLELLVSWPVILVVVIILVRKELPQLLTNLSQRITKGPFGLEFAQLQQQVSTLSAKVATLEKVTFEPSAALTNQLQTQLQASLDSFGEYMTDLGYQSKTGKVAVFVDPDLKNNVYYDGERGRIVLGEPLAEDTDALFREYTHHVLLATVDWNNVTGTWAAVESGLADYFACSFNNDPLFAEKSVHLFRSAEDIAKKPALRDLENKLKFQKVAGSIPIPQIEGESWGGAFWDLRKLLGRNAADKLLLATWLALRPSDAQGDFAVNFVTKVLATAESLGNASEVAGIKSIFKRRGLKL